MSYHGFGVVGVFYYKRPSSNRPAARAAWDYFARAGQIHSLKFLDGYWGCQRIEDGDIEEIDGCHFAYGTPWALEHA